jgi:hypothetical protein
MESTSQRGTLVAAASAVVSLLAAGSCCLPLGTILIAGGFAGLSAMIESYRPWLIGLSLVSLGAGFWQAYGRKQCAARRSGTSVAVLWIALTMIVVLLLFPQTIAGVLADVTTR